MGRFRVPRPLHIRAKKETRAPLVGFWRSGMPVLHVWG